jgi:gamma-glutamylcyclotransferase (GGCT)/AIG2-like uncharacterized protein YtfP
MPDPSERHVFVYGTLRRGERNDITRLAPSPRFVGTGSVEGTLYEVSWYPGLVLGEGGRVQGEVYAIDAALERRLDEIEEVWPVPTGEYDKRVVPVDVAGRVLYCIVYEIHPSRVVGRPVIASGDWIARG